MNSKLKFIVLFLAMAMVIPAFAHLKWTPENGTLIRQGHHVEWYRGGEGRFDEGQEEVAFVWSDCRWSDGGEGDRGIYFEVVNSNGEIVFGNEEGGFMVANGPGRQEDPGIWPSSDGGWFIAWEDFHVDSLGDIYCTKINSDYEVVWGSENSRRVPVSRVNAEQAEVRIVDDGEGGCIIAWKDRRNGDQGDLYAQHIQSDGTPDRDWPLNGMEVVRAAGAQASHTADADGAGGMILGWTDGRQEGNADIWAQRINADGELLWGNGEGLIVCGEGANQGTPKLCPDGSGGAFFTWVDERNVLNGETGKDIYAQRVSADGQLLWDEAGEALCTANAEQLSNRIIASRSGEAIVSWEDHRDDADILDIYAMRISGANSMVKEWDQAQGMPVCLDASNQQGTRLYADGEGGAFFVWEDERGGGTPEVDIWAQRLNLNGEPMWQNDGVPVCLSDYTQHSALIRRTADGVPVIIWADLRSGSQLVYIQRLNPDNGQPLLDVNGVVASHIEGFGGNGQDPILLTVGGGRVCGVWTDGRFGYKGQVPFIQFWEDGVENKVTLLAEHGVPVMDITGDSTLRGGGQVPAAVVGEDGSVFVVWEDHRSNQIYSIYAQRMSSEGEWLWGPGGVKAAGAPNGHQEQFAPFVCLDGEGGIITAWKGRPSEFDFQRNLFMQRFDANGNKLWGNDGIRLTFNGDDQDLAEMIYDPVHDGAIIIWTSDTRETGIDIWLTRVDLDGEIDPDFDDGDGGLVICDDYENQNNISASVHSDGVALVWVDHRDEQEDESATYIYGQFVLWDGTQKWRANGMSICDEEADLAKPVIAVDAQDDIWVVWEDHRNTEEGDSRIDIYMQKINFADNSVAFAGNGVPVCTADLNQLNPNIIANGKTGEDAGVWIFWEDYRYNSGLWADLFAHNFNLNGEGIGNWGDDAYGNGVPISRAFHGQEKPQLALLNDDGEGGVVAFWEDKRSTGKEELFNLYTQRIEGPVPVKDRESVQIPHGFAISDVYPNPFNSKALLTFTVPVESLVSLNLYDVNGRLVRNLSHTQMKIGQHQISIDGQSLASGIYVVRLEANDVRLERTLSLIK